MDENVPVGKLILSFLVKRFVYEAKLSFFAYGKLSMLFLVAFFFFYEVGLQCENHSSRRPFQFESCTAVLFVRIFRQHKAINLSFSYNGKVIGGKYYTNLSNDTLRPGCR